MSHSYGDHLSNVVYVLLVAGLVSGIPIHGGNLNNVVYALLVAGLMSGIHIHGGNLNNVTCGLLEFYVSVISVVLYNVLMKWG